ncbi:MAG: hypothetical protein JNN17_22575 [Verrucomicrobiaceae bacterium]|nr:hypothetical protein [Verrucomicrobiaceae bacterium]
MKRAPLLLAAVCFAAAPLRAQDAASPAAPAAGTPAEAPKPMSEEVQKLLQEAQKMRLENRYTDALAKLDEAEKIAPNEQLIFTMRGDVYMAPRRRDLALAVEQHKKALELDPKNPGPHFNIAEVEFGSHKFKEASASFRKLLTDFPKLPLAVRHLAWNRIVICEARQGNYEEAEKIIKAQFTFMDDTPAYQFSNAAISFAKKDEKMAQEWILRATSIFKEQHTSPYFDALKEMRWMKDVDFEALPDPSAGK